MSMDIKTLIFGITTFTIASIFFMFAFILYYQIGDEYILTSLDNTTTAIESNLGLTAPMSNYIHSLPVDYRNLNIPFDLIFLLLLISAIGMSIYSAAKVEEEGWFSFFGMVTVGMLIILTISGFISVLKDWLILNLFENLLQVNLQTMPIFYWWITHLGIFNFFWAIVLIIVNKMNFSYTRDYDTQDSLDGGEFQR